MKRLYVSDLDGTLFTTKKQLSDHTVRLLNACIDQGTCFAVATARMPYACDYRLSDLHLQIPSILTNGVFLYDFSLQEYLDVKVIAKEQVRQVLSVFKQQKTGVFLYTFLQNRISIFYNRPEMTRQTQYYSDKALKACKRVALCQDLESAAEQEDVVYLACTGSKEDLEPIKAAAEQIPGVRCAFYLNIYNGQYCLEIFSGKAAKSNALLALKRGLGCSEAVVFGDNLNDLSMIQAADRSYAVANALEEVKGRATDVIGSCDEDGVAKFIHREVFGC